MTLKSGDLSPKLGGEVVPAIDSRFGERIEATAFSATLALVGALAASRL